MKIPNKTAQDVEAQRKKWRREKRCYCLGFRKKVKMPRRYKSLIIDQIFAGMSKDKFMSAVQIADACGLNWQRVEWALRVLPKEVVDTRRLMNAQTRKWIKWYRLVK